MDSYKIFENFRNRISDSKSIYEYLHSLAIFMLECYRNEIITSGHGTFAHLKLSTVITKIGMGSPTAEMPLQRFGELLASLNEGHYNNVLDISLGNSIHELMVGTSDPVAAFHQHGDSASNTPARPFVLLQPNERIELNNMCRKWLAGEN